MPKYIYHIIREVNLAKNMVVTHFEGGLILRPKVINKSLHKNVTYKENGLTYCEMIRQEYTVNHCVISSGFVDGKNKPKVDTIYVKLEKDGVKPTILLLRPDEAQSLAWVSSGVVWSYLMDTMNKNCR
jgi:hypothetical protein